MLRDKMQRNEHASTLEVPGVTITVRMLLFKTHIEAANYNLGEA